MNDAILTIARGGMEITCRYAWALFLTQLAISRHFPLYRKNHIDFELQIEII